MQPDLLADLIWRILWKWLSKNMSQRACQEWLFGCSIPEASWDRRQVCLKTTLPRTGLQLAQPKNLFKELYIELKPLKETITSCDRGPVCQWRVPQLCSALPSEVFVVVLQRRWAVTPIRPGMVGMFSLVARWLHRNPEETIQATPGPPGPDLSPVFRPRNSSFSITRSLLSWKTTPFTKPQKHLYAWGNVQSLIIVALRSWLVFHVGSVWFSLILKFSEQIQGKV